MRLDAVVPRLDEVVALATPTPDEWRDAALDSASGQDVTEAYAVPPASDATPAPAASGSASASADPIVTVGGIPVAGVHVETDLRPRQVDEWTVVLEGTITIRLDRS